MGEVFLFTHSAALSRLKSFDWTKIRDLMSISLQCYHTKYTICDGNTLPWNKYPAYVVLGRHLCTVEMGGNTFYFIFNLQKMNVCSLTTNVFKSDKWELLLYTLTNVHWTQHHTNNQCLFPSHCEERGLFLALYDPNRWLHSSAVTQAPLNCFVAGYKY